MNVFQLSSLAVLAVFASINLANILRRRGRLHYSIAWLALFCGAAVAVARPDIAVRVAKFAGIGRGADLVFYCNALVTLGGFFYFYLRHRAIQRQLTVLTRELAIAHATVSRGSRAELPAHPQPEGDPARP